MTPDQMPPDFKNTIIRHIKLFQFIGLDILSVDETESSVLEKHGRLILFAVAFTILVVCNIASVVISGINGPNFVELANAVPITVVFLQDVMLLIIIAYRRNEIRELIFEISEVWPKDNNMTQEQKDSLKTWLRRLKWFENFYLTEAVASPVCFLSVPLLLAVFSPQQEVYQTPFSIYAPFKVDSVAIYLAKYAFETFTSFSLHLCTHVSTILILAALIVDISALMRLLQYDLENVVQERISMQRGYVDTSEHHREIKCVVKTHQKLLSLTAKLNTIFGSVVLVPTLLSSIILCLFGFICITSNDAQMIRNFVAVLAMLFEIFNLSWPGQLLADTSSSIATAAYESLWYDSDVKFRKTIITIIARSQNPCYLSAMGYTNMTLNTFSKIVSSSWSYLSVLRQIYQKNSDD